MSFPFRTPWPKKLLLTIGALILALLMAGLVLGFYSLKTVKEVVSHQFNQQQLEMAQHAASQLENQFANIIQELHTLNESPSVQDLGGSAWAGWVKLTLSALKELGVVEIGRVDGSGKRRLAMTDRDEVKVISGDFDREPPFQWARLPENKNRTRLVPDVPAQPGLQPQPLELILPTYLDSGDSAHPSSNRQFAGYLYLRLDPEYFVGKMIQGIRSGKTGYAWAINDRGNFLYHPLKEFIGKNAFEIRGQREAKISFDRINRIQQEKMLGGEKGTSWYVSGWHREAKGQIRKLMAFAPIRLKTDFQPGHWAVAVVAPGTEVDEVVREVYIRQFVMQGFILFAIILGGFLVIGLAWQGSKVLKAEVAEKTQDLQRSEERYKKLVESARDLIFSVDQRGDFISLNQYGAQLLDGRLPGPGARGETPATHYSEGAGKFISRSLMEFLGPPGGSFDSSWIDEVWQTGRPKSVEHTLRLEGNTWWLGTQLIAVKDRENRVQGILGISRDVTEKKEMERQMIHTEKLASLGLLAAGVAHEINNPVGIILGYCDYLMEKIPDADPLHDLLAKIEKQGLVCKKVVENLLSFSRSPDHLEGLGDVNANLENVLSVLNKPLVHKAIEIQKVLEPGLPKAGIDPIQLQQIFFNLIHNALGAMDKGGILTLRSRWDVNKDRIVVEIGDTGSGIPAEYRSRVFDPFFTTKKVGEGTGLGLSVTYGIIQNHQGSISFETRTPEEDPLNHGTLFTIFLPVYHSKGKKPDSPSLM